MSTPGPSSGNLWKGWLYRITRFLSLITVNLLLMMVLLYLFEFAFDRGWGLPRTGRFRGQIYTWGHLIKNNRFGFRERDFDRQKPPGVYRVLTLGDSLTWGVGLAPDQRYTAIAEQILNSSPLSRDLRFEVLNFGRNGICTVEEAEILNGDLSPIEADLIVVGFCLNDTQPLRPDHSKERTTLDRLTGNLVLRGSAWIRRLGFRLTSEVIEQVFYGIPERLGWIPNWVDALDRTYEPSSPEWQAFLQALRKICRVSKERGLGAPLLAILNQGAYSDGISDYQKPDATLQQFLRWYEQVRLAGERLGFRTYDHRSEIIEQLGPQTLAINIVDNHPSAELNQVYGEKLAAEISRRLSSHRRGDSP